MGSTFSTEAIVLFSTDVGEEDRILSFLTRDRGLVRAAASAAGNIRKGKSAPLDLFVRTSLHLYASRKEGKLKRIRTADVIEPFLAIRSDYRTLCAASYMSQTTAHCVQEDDPSPGTYELLLACLRGLEEGTDLFRVLLLFEVRLLGELGLMPELGSCLSCLGEIEKDAVLDSRWGGVIHRQCRGVEGGSYLAAGDLATLRFLSTRDLNHTAKLTVRHGDAKRIFGLVHGFAVHHLGYESKAIKMLKNEK
ncbi:MAG: DNA repair protein RecO [bacterium]|nr:DNA repair protein RecO [bacterium]MDT8396939.1 DNA repair protein RecO [bacterium]